MILFSTAGLYQIAEHRRDTLKASALDAVSMQALVDGVALIAGGEDLDIHQEVNSDFPYYVLVGREVLADWVAFEMSEYLTYEDFAEAVADTMEAKWVPIVEGIDEVVAEAARKEQEE